MRKYLATFGAMALGAIIMFGFTHSKVQAGNGPEPFVCSDVLEKGTILGTEYPILVQHCRVGKLDCGLLNATGNGGAISCVNTGGLFK
jgi:hypothetical protein